MHMSLFRLLLFLFFLENHHLISDWEEIFAKWAIFSILNDFEIFNGQFVKILHTL